MQKTQNENNKLASVRPGCRHTFSIIPMLLIRHVVPGHAMHGCCAICICVYISHVYVWHACSRMLKMPQYFTPCGSAKIARLILQQQAVVF